MGQRTLEGERIDRFVEMYGKRPELKPFQLGANQRVPLLNLALVALDPQTGYTRFIENGEVGKQDTDGIGGVVVEYANPESPVRRQRYYDRQRGNSLSTGRISVDFGVVSVCLNARYDLERSPSLEPDPYRPTSITVEPATPNPDSRLAEIRYDKDGRLLTAEAMNYPFPHFSQGRFNGQEPDPLGRRDSLRLALGETQVGVTDQNLLYPSLSVRNFGFNRFVGEDDVARVVSGGLPAHYYLVRNKVANRVTLWFLGFANGQGETIKSGYWHLSVPLTAPFAKVHEMMNGHWSDLAAMRQTSPMEFIAPPRINR